MSVGFVLAYLMNTNLCVLLVFFFRKDILHENKDRIGGAKGSEKRKKIRFYFCINDTFERCGGV